MHPLLAVATGTRWVSGRRDDSFGLSASSVAEQIAEHRPDVVFLCSPNNPTGTALALSIVEAAVAAAPGMVVVDEAYAEFRRPGTPSALSLLPGRQRLGGARTMSKALAVARGRVGVPAASASVAEA